MKLFNRKIEKCFADLKANAEKMLPCRYEVSFDVPDPYDCDKIASVLKLFFEEDLGYSVIIEAKKGVSEKERTTVFLTLS